MVDSVSLFTVGALVTDQTTGVVTVGRDLVWSGPGKVTTYEPQESSPEAAGATFTVQRYRLHIPVGSCAPKVGMIATVSSVLDPGLTGREFRVVALLHKSFTTAYRLMVEEVG